MMSIISESSIVPAFNHEYEYKCVNVNQSQLLTRAVLIIHLKRPMKFFLCRSGCCHIGRHHELLIKVWIAKHCLQTTLKTILREIQQYPEVNRPIPILVKDPKYLVDKNLTFALNSIFVSLFHERILLYGIECSSWLQKSSTYLAVTFTFLRTTSIETYLQYWLASCLWQFSKIPFPDYNFFGIGGREDFAVDI